MKFGEPELYTQIIQNIICIYNTGISFYILITPFFTSIPEPQSHCLLPLPASEELARSYRHLPTWIALLLLLVNTTFYLAVKTHCWYKLCCALRFPVEFVSPTTGKQGSVRISVTEEATFLIPLLSATEVLSFLILSQCMFIPACQWWYSWPAADGVSVDLNSLPLITLQTLSWYNIHVSLGFIRFIITFDISTVIVVCARSSRHYSKAWAAVFCSLSLCLLGQFALTQSHSGFESFCWCAWSPHIFTHGYCSPNHDWW